MKSSDLLLWCLEEKFGNEDAMRDELQPGVGKARGTTRPHYVVDMSGAEKHTQQQQSSDYSVFEQNIRKYVQPTARLVLLDCCYCVRGGCGLPKGMQYCVTDGVKHGIRYTQVTQQHDEEPTNTTSKRERERERERKKHKKCCISSG